MNSLVDYINIFIFIKIIFTMIKERALTRLPYGLKTGTVLTSNREDGFLVKLIEDKGTMIIAEVVKFPENPKIFINKSNCYNKPFMIIGEIRNFTREMFRFDLKIQRDFILQELGV